MDKRKILAWLFLLMPAFMMTPVLADLIVKPTTFVNRTPVLSAPINNDFDPLYNEFNGNISNANIKSGANIALSKFALTATATILMATGNPTFGAAQTADTHPRVSLYSSGVLAFGPGNAVSDIGLHRIDANTMKIADLAGAVDKALQISSLNYTDSLSQRLFYASPTSGSGVPTFRAIDLVDLPSGIGTATSVALSVPDFPLTITGSPITTSGTLAATPQAAKGDLIVGSGTNTYGRETVGANELMVMADSAQTRGLSYKRTARFGGDGSNGSWAPSGPESLTPGRTYNHTTASIDEDITWNGAIVNCTSTFLIANTATVQSNSGGYPGGAAQGTANNNGIRGYGPGRGMGGADASDTGGGGGGSPIAAGGDGGGAANQFSWGGLPPSAPVKWLGSGGGSGGTAGSGGNSAAAGAGGGCIRVLAVGKIELESTGTNVMQANGGAGGNAPTNAAGSGGGGAGSIFLWSETEVEQRETLGLVANGGAGGNGVGARGGGGGGAGGFVLCVAPIMATTGTESVAAGTGGTGTPAGSNGSAGTYTEVVATPNLPMVSLHWDGRGLLSQIAMDRASHWLRTGEHKNRFRLAGRPHVQWLAAWYAKSGQFDGLCRALLNGGGLEVAQMCALDVTASFKEYGVMMAEGQSPSMCVGDFEGVANGQT